MKTWVLSDGSRLVRLRGLRCSVFVLSSGDRHLVFDSSMKGERQLVVSGLRRLDVRCIDLLVFSHTHFDHVGNAAFLREAYKARVVVHRSEAGFLEAGNTPLPAGTNPLTAFLISLHARRGFPSFDYEACPPDLTVDDRLDLTPMGFPAFLIHTPGHSRGSMSLIIREEIALVGDTMFGQIPGVVFPIFADDPSALMKSWERLLITGSTNFLPAHGLAVSRRMLEVKYQKMKAFS